MSMKRECLLCGKAVPIQRRMSLFCCDPCENRYGHLKAAPPPPVRSGKGKSLLASPHAESLAEQGVTPHHRT